jgi:hypothetical protein
VQGAKLSFPVRSLARRIQQPWIGIHEALHGRKVAPLGRKEPLSDTFRVNSSGMTGSCDFFVGTATSDHRFVNIRVAAETRQ